jgi:DinB family protein
LEFDLPQAMAILERTPAVLTAGLDGLGDEWVQAREGPDTFSPFDVVGHLVHGERTDWIPRARLILDRGESVPFEPFDRFAMRRISAGRTIGELLVEFATLRRANLEVLDGWNLVPSDLDRRGRHPELGAVTLRQLLATWVVHDLSHVAQVARVLAKQYTGEVGPWVAYHPILTR